MLNSDACMKKTTFVDFFFSLIKIFDILTNELSNKKCSRCLLIGYGYYSSIIYYSFFFSASIIYYSLPMNIHSLG